MIRLIQRATFTALARRRARYNAAARRTAARFHVTAAAVSLTHGRVTRPFRVPNAGRDAPTSTESQGGDEFDPKPTWWSAIDKD